MNSALIAGLGGLAVGWSYAEIQAGLPPRPWTALAVFALVVAILTPALVLAQLRPPPLNLSTGAIIDGSRPAVVIIRVTLELLLTATLVGALAGWRLGHTGRAAFATILPTQNRLAGFIFALAPGHNIPLLGNTPAVGKGVVLLGLIIFVAAVVLVEGQA